MKFVAFLRGVLAILVAFFYNALVTFPHLFFLAGVNVLASPTAFRDRVSQWMTWHGDRLFRILCWILDLRVVFKMPAEDLRRIPGPLIVISNHQSTMDIPLVYYVMETLGRPWLRWIIKRDLWWTPFGWFGYLTKCAFVRRKGQDPEGDREAIRQCGACAFEDVAAVVNYPEGTRVTKPSPGFKHLKAPKVDGFNLLREQMPTAGVLSITLRWSRKSDDAEHGRTWLDAFHFVGKRLTIWADYIAPEVVAQDPDWLLHHWQGKDALLDAAL